MASFDGLQGQSAEKAIKRWFDWGKKDWSTAPVIVRIAGRPFAEGDTHRVHTALVQLDDGTHEQCVAKEAKSHFGAKAYEARVMMQAVCQAVAKAYNDRKPPKPVTFNDCFMIQRDDQSWWQMEAYLPGVYEQHNDVTGFVEKGSRNTPQAFSHFSYEFMDQRMMIVDIQGVDDTYTDPQVLTLDGQGYGKGNTGEKGIENFLDGHWCNSLCNALGLPFMTPKKFGIAKHKHPQRGGTTLDLPADGETPTMRVSEFVGHLRPATVEELAILGLTSEQYGTLLKTFKAREKSAKEQQTAEKSCPAGLLDKDDLVTLFKQVHEAMGSKFNPAEAAQFQERAAKLVDAEGRISFRSVVLCWTDNE
eukprot:EG_transcript_11646